MNDTIAKSRLLSAGWSYAVFDGVDYFRKAFNFPWRTTYEAYKLEFSEDFPLESTEHHQQVLGEDYPLRSSAWSKGKPQLSRLRQFKRSLEAVCRVLEHGEKKHGSDLGWLTYPTKDDIDAIGRHFLDSPMPDDETGESHLIHLVCRALFAHEKWLNEQNTNTKNS